MLAALSSDLRPDEQVQLDLPVPIPAAVQLATDAGMQPVFRNARMYLGSAPNLLPEEIYRTTSFELG